MRKAPEIEYTENPQKANWVLMGKHRDIFKGSVLSGVDYERVKVSRRRNPKNGKESFSINGGPYLRLASVFEYVDQKGGVTPVSQVGLFTWTSKMSCPSFSLPAGPMESGGTCPAAKRSSIEKEGSYSEFHEDLGEMAEGEKFICDLCYAGKGFYSMFALTGIRQKIRFLWTQQELRRGTFIGAMTEAIAALKDHDVERVLTARELSIDFFRIHDSGDFYSPEYYRAWVEICYNLPKVKFWAPTRMWVYEKWRQVFANYPPPKNLSLRPSALFTSAPPPSVPGMAAGSTSVDGDMDDPVWNCPAYEGEDEHSCAAAGCRVCWVAMKKPVNYLTH